MAGNHDGSIYGSNGYRQSVSASDELKDRKESGNEDMSMRLVFWKLELKRAYRRFPQMFAGAIALLFLAGAIALLAGRALYGDTVM